MSEVPANTWIPHVAPSSFDAATAFVVFDNHRRSDWTPYVYRTSDFGQSWMRLAAEDDVWGYALSIAQDPVDPSLLFLGTEFGLYVSTDGGGDWFKWTHGVPTVGVRDLVVQPREHDLVLGTHGRAAYILDDISALRGLTAEVLSRPLHLFQIPEAIQHRVKQTGASRFPGDGEFRGENESYGAMITFSANQPDLPHPDEKRARAEGQVEQSGEAETAEAEPGDRPHMAEPGGGPGRGPGGREKGPQVKIEVLDDSGELVRTFEQPVKLGVNRVTWNLRGDAFKRPETGEPQEVSPFQRSGRPVLPGTYAVRLSLNDHEAEGTVRILADPRENISGAERVAKHEAMTRAGEVRDVLAEAITRIYRTRKDVDVLLGKVRLALKEADQTDPGDGGEGAADEEDGEDSPLEALQKSGQKLKKTLTELEKKLWIPPDTKGIPYDDDRPWSKSGQALFALGSSSDAPTPAQLAFLRSAEEAVGDALTEVNRVFAEDVSAFRELVADSELELLPRLEPLELPDD